MAVFAGGPAFQHEGKNHQHIALADVTGDFERRRPGRELAYDAAANRAEARQVIRVRCLVDRLKDTEPGMPRAGVADGRVSAAGGPPLQAGRAQSMAA